MQFVQKILFGPPGCGKSFHVRKFAIDDLKIASDVEELKSSPYMIETTFHPEFGYGDFVAKLLPKTSEARIEYHIHAGPLIKAIAQAIADDDNQVLLVIDEINRGNCAQIFGDIFQLLDRNGDGHSEYGIDLSDLTRSALAQELKKISASDDLVKTIESNNYKLRLPNNLSLIGTMNTSDESVYYMDTAFKRRWEFEYMRWDGRDTPQEQSRAKIEGAVHEWCDFLARLNGFIAEKFKGWNVEDKQIGIWFSKAVSCKKKAESALFSDLVTFLNKTNSQYKKKDWENALKAIHLKTEVHGYSASTSVIVDVRTIGDLMVDVVAELGDRHQLSETDQTIQMLLKIFGSFSGKEQHAEWSSNFDKIQKEYQFLKSVDFNQVKISEMNRGGVNLRPDIGTIGEFFRKIVDVYFDSITREEFNIEKKTISGKLMFFLWDNVFSRDRSLLEDLLGLDRNTLRTFGDFSSDENVEAFINGVMARSPQ